MCCVGLAVKQRHLAHMSTVHCRCWSVGTRNLVFSAVLGISLVAGYVLWIYNDASFACAEWTFYLMQERDIRPGTLCMHGWTMISVWLETGCLLTKGFITQGWFYEQDKKRTDR